MTRDEARTAALAGIERILDLGGDADDVLRRVVAALAPLYAYAAVDFVEESGLVTGPEHGTRGNDATRTPIAYDGIHVGDLVVEGGAADDGPFLAGVATLVAAHVLLGWDTGGEAWEP
jgi:hypothetical protein